MCDQVDPEMSWIWNRKRAIDWTGRLELLLGSLDECHPMGEP